jgi:L-ascorbate metabolism protein UlaG (beta-lactamase superfamily)
MTAGEGYRITYVGHATLLIEIGGVRLLTDPLLRQHVMHLRRRSTPIPTHVYTKVDAVLLSHLHYDHLDLPSLRKLGKTTRLLVPVGAGALLRQQGFENVAEVRIGDPIHFGSVTVTPSFALHSGARGPFGPAAETLGFVVSQAPSPAAPLTSTTRIYFAGDTDIFPQMADMAGSLDLALLPVWGWGPTLGAGHMDPVRAAEAARILAPRATIPIHWGTFYPIAMHHLLPSFLINPPQIFHAAVQKMAPEVAVHILQPGQHFERRYES